MHTARKLGSVAAQASTSKLSTVHRGNAFEERSLKVLQDNLSMSLKRVGGKSDGGVDLQGWWWLPPVIDTTPSVTDGSSSDIQEERRRLRVFAQCKAEKKKFSPNYVREMEGVLYRYTSHSETGILNKAAHSKYLHVALLVSESAFTTSTLLRAQSSPVPFFLLHLPPVDVEKKTLGEQNAECVSRDNIGAAFWNPALGGRRGILGGQIEARWERTPEGGLGRPGLWWQGGKLQSWTPDKVVADLEEGYDLGQ